jgi:hypothetical protein
VHQDGLSGLKTERAVAASAAEVATKKGDARIASHFKGQKILQYQ